MKIATRKILGCVVWGGVTLIAAYFVSRHFVDLAETAPSPSLTDGEIMTRLIAIPLVLAAFVVALIAGTTPASAAPAVVAAKPITPQPPFMAQVVGLQWLNPLQRVDYPTEWQLLWTMGFVKPNAEDAKVKQKPEKYTKVQQIGDIAYGNNGKETFEGYHYKYISELITPFRDIYFSDSSYFYNAHSLTDKTTWRELAGIHVEFALPAGKLDPGKAGEATREEIIGAFDIGNKSFPNAWSRATPPDVRVTMGGANAGFTSLAAGLTYLQSHPAETVWVMNWDAPSRPLDAQINENMVLLFLAGADYKTGRAPLAWLGHPASARVDDFERKAELPPRLVQAWKAVFDKAAAQAQKQTIDIGFIIHDANNVQVDSSDRLAGLARTATEAIPEFDFVKQTFNTPALLGDMGAGTALTNVALAIAYANHFGKTVLVAGTTDPANPGATVVVPPAVVRPIDSAKPWFRARSIIHAHLPWWGVRFDAKETLQGFSE